MDRTLKRGTGRNRRRLQRNGSAWQLFCPDGETCRYCPHDGSQHLVSSGQPHFYRPATREEGRDPDLTLYTHDVKGQGTVLLRRITVSKQAEIITAFCTPCAEAAGTGQVLCYQRSLATGEVVGLHTHFNRQREGEAA